MSLSELECRALGQPASQEKNLFYHSTEDQMQKINHQINISSNTTFARTLRKYSFDAKLCMRPRWFTVLQGGWLTGLRHLRVCLSHRRHCLPTWPPAAMRKLPGLTLQRQQQLSLLSAQTGCGIDPVKHFSPLRTPTQPPILASSIKI